MVRTLTESCYGAHIGLLMQAKEGEVAKASEATCTPFMLTCYTTLYFKVVQLADNQPECCKSQHLTLVLKSQTLLPALHSLCPPAPDSHPCRHDIYGSCIVQDLSIWLSRRLPGDDVTNSLTWTVSSVMLVGTERRGGGGGRGR